jgi:hypothetical protein
VANLLFVYIELIPSNPISAIYHNIARLRGEKKSSCSRCAHPTATGRYQCDNRGQGSWSVIRQRWPNGPKIITITAFALKGDRERFTEAGMDDYIYKPVQKDDLAKVLAKYG